MKILFITYANPEKCDRGDHIYSWNVLQALNYNDNKIHFVSLVENYENCLVDSNLYQFCNKVTFVDFKPKSKISLVLSNYPASIRNRYSISLINKVVEILNSEDIDLIVVNHFKLSYLIKYLKKYPQQKIIVTHDIESELSKSVYKGIDGLHKKLIYWQDFKKVKRYESKFVGKYDLITTICDFDRFYFEKNTTKKTILLPPNIKLNNCLSPKLSVLKTAIICGNFLWEPKKANLMLLLNAKNISKLRKANVQLLIVGQADVDFVNFVNSSYENVKMTGWVESVDKYYKQSHVALIPEVLGGGFKIKIAEAVQYNLPIIAIKGSVTDFEMKDGSHFLEVDTFEEMIVATIALLLENESLVANSNNLFLSKYNIENIKKNLFDSISI